MLLKINVIYKVVEKKMENKLSQNTKYLYITDKNHLKKCLKCYKNVVLPNFCYKFKFFLIKILFIDPLNIMPKTCYKVFK